MSFLARKKNKESGACCRDCKHKDTETDCCVCDYSDYEYDIVDDNFSCEHFYPKVIWMI